MSSKPNILFLITDQQRADSMGCYGNPAGTTPNLDQLAADGLVFDQAYCESPICMPSRVTLLTGKYAEQHGVVLHNNNIRPEERTLADTFNNAGYYTHCIGKMHMYSQEQPGNPESLPDWRAGMHQDFQGPFCGFQGCDLILGHSNSVTGHYGEWVKKHHPAAVETFWTENHEAVADRKKFHITNAFRTDIPEEAHSSYYVAEQCKKVFGIAEEQEQPFFCYASFPDPHWPVCPPGTWFDKFKDAELPPRIPYHDECDRDDLPPQYKAIKNGTRYYNGGCRFIGHEHAEEIEAIRRGYHAAVAFIDYNVGRIIDDLKQRGLYDNTIIIYTTDHGDYLGDHGLQAKGGFLYESFIRTPMLIRDPQGLKGKRITAPFSFVDVAETLCDLADVEYDLAGSGISQAVVCRGEQQQVREHCTVTHFAHSESEDCPADQHAIIFEDWKLVYTAGQEHGLLFDLNNDPQELENLWHNKDHAEQKQALLNRLFTDMHLRKHKQAIRDKSASLPGYYNHLMVKDFWQDQVSTPA